MRHIHSFTFSLSLWELNYKWYSYESISGIYRIHLWELYLFTPVSGIYSFVSCIFFLIVWVVAFINPCRWYLFTPVNGIHLPLWVIIKNNKISGNIGEKKQKKQQQCIKIFWKNPLKTSFITCKKMFDSELLKLSQF